jgi:hypothetical protein
LFRDLSSSYSHIGMKLALMLLKYASNSVCSSRVMSAVALKTLNQSLQRMAVSLRSAGSLNLLRVTKLLCYRFKIVYCQFLSKVCQSVGMTFLKRRYKSSLCYFTLESRINRSITTYGFYTPKSYRNC